MFFDELERKKLSSDAVVNLNLESSYTHIAIPVLAIQLLYNEKIY